MPQELGVVAWSLPGGLHAAWDAGAARVDEPSAHCGAVAQPVAL
ncbi:MAG: hypothetical protein Q8P22_11450 [Chloroflexota bacterium]|nr:hypothetical protein [Chloroflexota bacterium]